MSLIGSHTGNTRDPYNPQDSGSRPQVEGPVRPRGAVSRSRDPERSAIQPALDRSRRRRRVVRCGRQQLHRPARGGRRREPRVRPSPLRGGAAAPDRPNSRRQLHDRAPRGAGPAAGGARARRLEPDAILFERCGGGGGSAPPGEVAHRAYRGPGILGRLPRQDRRRAPRARRELQARARAAHAGRLSLTLRGVRALRLRQDLSVVRMALRGVPQAEGGARDHQGRGGDHRRADPGHGGQCRAAARLPPGIASPRG